MGLILRLSASRGHFPSTEEDVVTDGSPAPHPPEPPSMTIGTLRDLLADLPADWHISTEDLAMLLIFDAAMEARAAIEVRSGTITPVPPDAPD